MPRTLHTVTVTAEWRSAKTFEFDERLDAEKFYREVNDGNLDALVEAGDVDTSNAELVNYHAALPREGLMP